LSTIYFFRPCWQSRSIKYLTCLGLTCTLRFMDIRVVTTKNMTPGPSVILIRDCFLSHLLVISITDWFLSHPFFSPSILFSSRKLVHPPARGFTSRFQSTPQAIPSRTSFSMLPTHVSADFCRRAGRLLRVMEADTVEACCDRRAGRFINYAFSYQLSTVNLWQGSWLINQLSSVLTLTEASRRIMGARDPLPPLVRVYVTLWLRFVFLSKTLVTNFVFRPHERRLPYQNALDLWQQMLHAPTPDVGGGILCKYQRESCLR